MRFKTFLSESPSNSVELKCRYSGYHLNTTVEDIKNARTLTSQDKKRLNADEYAFEYSSESINLLFAASRKRYPALMHISYVKIHSSDLISDAIQEFDDTDILSFHDALVVASGDNKLSYVFEFSVDLNLLVRKFVDVKNKDNLIRQLVGLYKKGQHEFVGLLIRSLRNNKIDYPELEAFEKSIKAIGKEEDARGVFDSTVLLPFNYSACFAFARARRRSKISDVFAVGAASIAVDISKALDFGETHGLGWVSYEI